jgi:hypothetical protein
MRDDAVAPVVAVMLILAVIVTFLSVWNAVVIPSMKQSVEIEHLRNVESAFQHFASDIEKSVSLRQDNLVFSEPVQLGGGDVMFDTLRSSGSLYVQNEENPIYTITLYDGNQNVIGEMNGTLVNFSYEPLGNFWHDQGYRWQYGFINVTKYRTRETPLGYYNMTDVMNEFEGDGSLAAFARSFRMAEYMVNQSAISGNCSAISLIAVNLTASQAHHFASGNGYGILKLKSTLETTPYAGVYHIMSVSDQGPFGNAQLINWNSSLTTIARACEGNVWYRQEYSGSYFADYWIEQQVNPVQVTLKTISVEVGAY